MNVVMSVSLQRSAASRGAVVIRDREGLIALADGSYGIPEGEYERLVGKFGRSA
jgi:hypothetical protein